MPLKTTEVLDESQLTAVGRFFSSAVVQDLARHGRSALLGRLLRESNFCEFLPSREILRDVFDRGLQVLAHNRYRHEYVYKDVITRKILLGMHSLRTAVMLPEFRVGNCKADVAILNGTSTVYEIKSERDRLDRLDSQLENYLKVFARVNVIAGRNHVAKVLASVPEHVGVLVLSDRLSISTVRPAVENLDRISPATLFDSLQLHEAEKILRLLGLPPPDVPNTERHQALRKLFVTLDPHAAHHAMIEVLRKTRDMSRMATLVSALPESLRAAALSTPLRKADHNRIIAAMDRPVLEARAWAV